MANEINHELVRWFDSLDSEDIPSVGGKNASLGEMLQALRQQGIRVPGGFATTADAYWRFLDSNDLKPQIQAQIDSLHHKQASLQQVGKNIRRLFLNGAFPEHVSQAIRQAYQALSE